jgi:hypothetical protein
MLNHQRVGEFNWDISWDVTDVTNHLDMIMRDQLISMDSKIKLPIIYNHWPMHREKMNQWIKGKTTFCRTNPNRTFTSQNSNLWRLRVKTMV